MCGAGAALEDYSPEWEKVSGVWLSHGQLVKASSDVVESKKQICFAVVTKQTFGHKLLITTSVPGYLLMQWVRPHEAPFRALPVSQPPSPDFIFCSFLRYLLAVQHQWGMIVISTCALLPPFEKWWAVSPLQLCSFKTISNAFQFTLGRDGFITSHWEQWFQAEVMLCNWKATSFFRK